MKIIMVEEQSDIRIDKYLIDILNFSRTKRLDKTAKIDAEHAKVFQNISSKQTWLVITEPWCGDAAHPARRGHWKAFPPSESRSGRQPAHSDSLCPRRARPQWEQRCDHP